MIHQLRIYQINPDLKEAFETRFRDHALRIMKMYDFDIKAMWFSESEGKTEFVYILQWPDVETLQKQWQAFLADTEWQDIKQKSLVAHGEMVLAKVRDQVLDGVAWFKNELLS